MYLKIQIQLKKIPKCAILEKILGQELPLFEAGNIEVTTGHFFLKRIFTLILCNI